MVLSSSKAENTKTLSSCGTCQCERLSESLWGQPDQSRIALVYLLVSRVSRCASVRFVVCPWTTWTTCRKFLMAQSLCRLAALRSTCDAGVSDATEPRTPVLFSCAKIALSTFCVRLRVEQTESERFVQIAEQVRRVDTAKITHRGFVLLALSARFSKELNSRARSLAQFAACPRQE